MGESPDMGLSTMPFWIALNAVNFRHCGLAPLNYQPYFDRIIESGMCGRESAVGKQFENSNELITQWLGNYTDEQFSGTK
jgi:hypothetical protein